jgi:putative hemolysin
MRIKTLIAGAALTLGATGALIAAQALPAAALPFPSFPSMTPTDLKLFCDKNGGAYNTTTVSGERFYWCELPNGKTIFCDVVSCVIAIDPPSTTPPRPIVEPTVIATTTR